MDLDSFFTDIITSTSSNDFRGASNLLVRLLSSSVCEADPSCEELVQVIKDVLDMAGDTDVERNDYTESKVYLPSIIVDILWLLDQDELLLPVQRERLNEIGQLLLEKKLINASMAMERLEPEFLEAIHAIQDAKAFDKKIVRTKTNLLYKQTKFNLLREESEGYSKLCVEMVEHLVQPLDYYWSADKAEKKMTHQDLALIRMVDVEEKTAVLMDNITSLIGYFDMDPIRVLDLVLDGFISQCLDYWDFYICLLKKSPWKPVDGVPKKVVAQIIGFKFRLYSRTGQAVNTPVQLYWTAAVLIREGIVALDDMYPHLDPEDSLITNDFFKYLSGLQKAASKAGRFAPTKMAGSLDDTSDSAAVPAVEEEKTIDELSVTKSQKAGLAIALASLGDLKNLRIIIDRVPALSKMHPDIAENICRILHVVVEDLDKPLRPFAALNRKAPPSIHEFPPPVSSFNSRLTPIFERITTGKKHYPNQYKFFYDNWRDQAPRPSNYSNLLKVLKTLLPYIGIHLYRDVLLTGKLIRIGRNHVKESINDEGTKNSWLAIISQFLFPAMSQIPTNPSLANELWTFVKLWPYSVRYALYGEWKHETYDAIPEMEIASAGCRKDIQYIMNRLSKDNIKTYGRLIGKIVHSNPTIAFSYILNAIESYDNMIPFVVEATRYLTALEFDILSFCLIEALARESKVRIERNGTTIEKWLKSLSNFCGTLFAKYKIDLDGILKYLTNQLLSDQIYDLIVLQELISSMSGISPPEDATAAQLDGMAGGEVIRRESLIADSHLLRRSTSRLVQALLKTELAQPFGILLALQKKEIAFRLGNSDPFTAPDLKVIAWLSDQCQKSFLQYFEFLENNAGSARYAKISPPVNVLIEKYGLDIPSAFHIVRPHLSNLMKKGANGLKENNFVNSSPPGSPMDVDEDLPSDFDLPSSLIDISNQVSGLGIRKDLSLTFFVTFWQLGLSDISVPHARYDSEIKKKLAAIEALDKETGRGASKRKKDKDRLQQSIHELKKEWASQKEAYSKTQERLKTEKENWFLNIEVPRSEIINQMLQNCIYPRCVFSAGDALYCAKFIELLHDKGTANLSIVSLYDRILNRDSLHAVVFSLTESEAKNFGSFLNLCLKKLTYWHSRKSVYEKNALAPGCPGFLVKFPDESISADDFKTLKMFDYEDFRAAMHKWHLKMRKCFLQCLSSGDYMQLRNGMIILNKISEYFPLIDYMGKELESSVSKIEKKEDRSDVKQMARSYYANLRRRKSHWVPTVKFCNQPKPTPVEDEVAESVESMSVAEVAEDHLEVVEEENGDVQLESGEVKVGSEMDVDEPSIMESGAEIVEARIVSIVSNTQQSVEKSALDVGIAEEDSVQESNDMVNVEKEASPEGIRDLDAAQKDRNSHSGGLNGDFDKKESRYERTDTRDNRTARDWRQESSRNSGGRFDDRSRRDQGNRNDDRNSRRDEPPSRRDEPPARRDDAQANAPPLRNDVPAKSIPPRREDSQRDWDRYPTRRDEPGRKDSRNSKSDDNPKNPRFESLAKQDDIPLNRDNQPRISNQISRGNERFRTDSRIDDRSRIDLRDNRDRPEAANNDSKINQQANEKSKMDAERVRQISKEEKDRLLLERIEREKKSLEINIQQAQAKNNHPVVGEVQRDEHTRGESNNAVPENVGHLAVSSKAPLLDGSRKNDRDQGNSRPRFERPQRASKPKNASEPPQNQTEINVTPAPHPENSNSAEKTAADAFLERPSSTGDKVDTARNNNSTERQRDEHKRDAGNRDDWSNNNRRGNYRQFNDRRGDFSSRGGRMNNNQDRGGESRRGDDNRRGGNYQYQQKGGSLHAREESKRLANQDDRDINDAKRFKINR